MVHCEGDYVHWIATGFGECVVTSREKLSFAFGIASTLIWMWAQLPQIYINFKIKSCDGLSLYFLLFLILGDSSNLIGAILTGGMVTQIITSTFFCFMDCFVFVQYIFFECIFKKCNAKETKELDNVDSEKSENMVPVVGVVGAVAAVAASYANPYSKDLILGTLIGWISATVYTTSRCFQIYKNYKNKKTEGVSPQFFISAWLGNATYAISIFLRDSHWGYLWLQFPWLIGSLTPLSLDFFVLYQFFRYRKNNSTEESKKDDSVSEKVDFSEEKADSYENDHNEEQENDSNATNVIIV
ncbi:PQ loop repeat family protein [Trichomonas vaginalis G3]|uniref:PQ loop repeat family protein n=1 Tax=Trichomonas vaginalis (strain ATCC PRA-98 / G3) TaxID=412133 RepID=A2ETQ8_TRIV3|nr:basic amino acid transmembrane export protein, SEVEN transmembrane protein 1-related family [Trichomonas vaginalis G3]EAY03939.1 PQ loop repeat family protein [Trichomonas vaginalis G3]KAI5541041.1 basic amino acid transmembrane export protein, SEVEN transmembrane protein 1-related family [Trichomonas vaginalis G3]|eukprot:XP_001316162.1 PQ loop repeat family protein [Trichomonas vaginalis G3]